MNKVNSKILAIELGYKSSKNKPDLYYRNTDNFCFFINFNSYETHNDNYLYYCSFKTKTNIEEWKINRLVNKEKIRLKRNGLNIDFLNIPIIDGYCKNCHWDMKADELFCKKCKNNLRFKIRTELFKHISNEINQANSCMICGKKLDLNIEQLASEFLNDKIEEYDDHWINSKQDYHLISNFFEKSNINSLKKKNPEYQKTIEHHICYDDELMIDVCKKCHNKIHHSNEISYQQYRPIDKRILSKNKTILIPCSNKNCFIKARIPLEKYQPDKLYYCYNCQQKIYKNQGYIVIDPNIITITDYINSLKEKD